MKNTTNNMNKLNKLMNKKAGKAVVVSVDTLVENRNNDVLASVYNGTVELKQLLNITDKCIDMTQCERPIQIMQKIYQAGSEVGTTTTRGQNAYMIDVEIDEGFEAFKNCLVMLKAQDQHVPYTTVWQEDYNMFTFEFEDGHFYSYYVVTNEEIAMLRDKIQMMSKDKMTKEDAHALQADLPPFIRAFQESSIDVSKDKDKVFTLDGKTVTIKAFINSIPVYSSLTKTYKDSISFGFDTVKKAKHAGKVVPSFKYTNEARDAEKPAMDLMGHVTKALEETATDKLNGAMKSLYAVSNNDLYAPFISDCEISRELAYFIKGVYNICYDSINDTCKMDEERFATLRNVIYTAALNYGVDREDVIKVAIATAMTKVFKDKEGNIITKDANVNRFKQYPVANIFPDEFVSILADIPVYDTFVPEKIIYSITRDIEDNEEITFVDGVSEDGSIELYDATFNGTLVEYEGNFICFKDVYAFNVTHALLANENTFKETATKEELMRVKSGDKAACDKGQYLNSVHEQLHEAVITGANANLLTANKHYLCQFIANYNAVKGATAIKDIITYDAANGAQQSFLIIL